MAFGPGKAEVLHMEKKGPFWVGDKNTFTCAADSNRPPSPNMIYVLSKNICGRPGNRSDHCQMCYSEWARVYAQAHGRPVKIIVEKIGVFGDSDEKEKTSRRNSIEYLAAFFPSEKSLFVRGTFFQPANLP